MKIIIATIKSWNIENAEKFKRFNTNHDVYIVAKKEELDFEKVKKINPDFIFFTHWSWIIKKEFFDNFNCVVFHMTDLPFGRGGSPLQNLLSRGIYNTKISAIKVNEGLDTGDVYLKKDIDITDGNADQIFKKVSDIVFNEMIPQILNDKLAPTSQCGEIVEFERRIPAQSEIKNGLNFRQLYDHIRMLDGEGYPNAFITFGDYVLEFKNARINDCNVECDTIWRKKDE